MGFMAEPPSLGPAPVFTPPAPYLVQERAPDLYLPQSPPAPESAPPIANPFDPSAPPEAILELREVQRLYVQWVRRRNPTMSKKELAEKLGIVFHTLQNLLQECIESGLPSHPVAEE